MQSQRPDSDAAGLWDCGGFRTRRRQWNVGRGQMGEEISREWEHVILCMSEKADEHVGQLGCRVI